MFDDLHHLLISHPSSALIPHDQVASHLPPYCSPSILEGPGRHLKQMVSSAAYLLMHWRSIDDVPPPIVILTSLAQPLSDPKEDEDDTNVEALLSLLELNDPSRAPSPKGPGSNWPPSRGMIHVISPEQLFSSKCWGKDHPDSAAIKLTESILFLSRGSEGPLESRVNHQDPSEGPAHWSSQTQVMAGLASGLLIKGELDVSRRSRREGVVLITASSRSTEDEDEGLSSMSEEDGKGDNQAGRDARKVEGDQLGRMLRVSGLAAMNRAMHGDTVVVRLIPCLVAPDDTEEEDTLDHEEGEEADIDVFDAGNEGRGGGGQAFDLSSGASLPLAQVVAVVSREQMDVVACLRREDEETLILSSSQSEIVLALPLDPRLPLVRLRTRQAQQLINQRFVVKVDSWERGSRWPSGHLVKILGPLGDLKAESEAVLIKCGINHLPFCQGAINELPRVSGYQHELSDRSPHVSST